MATAGSVVIDLLLKTGSFISDTDRAEKRMRQMDKEARKLGVALGTALATGATAAAGAIVYWTKEAAQTAVEMDRLAKLSNVGVVEFQKLSAAASRVGFDHGKLGDVFKDTQDKIGDFLQTGGGPLADFFEHIAPGIGLTAEAMANMAGPDALGAYVKALEAANLSQTEMVYHLENIASDASLLLPLLKDGAAGFREYGDQAERAGAIMGEDGVRAAKEFHHEIAQLDAMVDGFKNQLAAELLPELVELSQEFRENVLQGSNARDAVDALMVAFGGVVEIGKGTINTLTSIRNLLGEIDGGASSGAESLKQLTTVASGLAAIPESMMAFLEAKVTGSEDAVDRFEEANDRIRSAWSRANMIEADLRDQIADSLAPLPASYYADAAPDSSQWYGATPPRRPAASKSSGGKGRNAAADALREQQEAQRALAEQVAKTMQAHADFDTTLEDLRAELGGPLAQAELDHIRAMEDITALAVAGEVEDRDLIAAKQLLDEQYRRVTEAIKAQRTPVEQMLEDLQFERELIGKTREEQELLTAARWLGVEAATAQGQAALGALEINQRMREYTDTQAEAMDGLRESTRGLLYDLKEGVGVFDALENAAERFLDVLFDIAAQQVVENMFGKQGDAGGGSWGDAIGGLIGSWFGGGRASGGDVMPRTAYLVGEQGPEMFVPRTAGTIVPAAATESMRRGSTPMTGNSTTNWYVQGSVDPRSAEQIALAERRRQLEATARA